MELAGGDGDIIPEPPKNLKELHRRELKDQQMWTDAINKELDGLRSQKIWKLMTLKELVQEGHVNSTRRPSKRAWRAAMHMVYYLHGQRNQGIMFRSDGNAEPVCFYDSSDKGDPTDQRASGGYCIMLAGGPIAWRSH
eukprot:COSAG04_NODE_47_length_31265_cov_18.823012_10_plen_138_part_00